MNLAPIIPVGSAPAASAGAWRLARYALRVFHGAARPNCARVRLSTARPKAYPPGVEPLRCHDRRLSRGVPETIASRCNLPNGLSRKPHTEALDQSRNAARVHFEAIALA